VTLPRFEGFGTAFPVRNAYECQSVHSFFRSLFSFGSTRLTLV
jgi:hypothetical protein